MTNVPDRRRRRLGTVVSIHHDPPTAEHGGGAMRALRLESWESEARLTEVPAGDIAGRAVVVPSPANTP